MNNNLLNVAINEESVDSLIVDASFCTPRSGLTPHATRDANCSHVNENESSKTEVLPKSSPAVNETPMTEGPTENEVSPKGSSKSSPFVNASPMTKGPADDEVSPEDPSNSSPSKTATFSRSVNESRKTEVLMDIDMSPKDPLVPTPSPTTATSLPSVDELPNTNAPAGKEVSPKDPSTPTTQKTATSSNVSVLTMPPSTVKCAATEQLKTCDKNVGEVAQSLTGTTISVTNPKPDAEASDFDTNQKLKSTDNLIDLKSSKQNKLATILHQTKDSGLVDVLDLSKLMQGGLLFFGHTSSGKSTMIRRLMGLNLLPSQSGITTKATTKVTSINDPLCTSAKIEVILPELRAKDGKVIKEKTKKTSLKETECHNAVLDFFNSIPPEGYVTSPIEVTVRSSYVLNLTMYDFQGLEYKYGKDICKDIFKKQISSCARSDMFLPVICQDITRADADLSSVLDSVVEIMGKEEAILSNVITVLTHIDKSKYLGTDDEDCKANPFFELSELLRGKRCDDARFLQIAKEGRLIAVFNGNTKNSKHKHLSAREIIDVENEWKNKNLNPQWFKQDIRSKIGLAALIRLIDVPSIQSLHPFIKLNLEQTKDLMETTHYALHSLGDDPMSDSFSVDEMKSSIEEKLAAELAGAKQNLMSKTEEFWRRVEVPTNKKNPKEIIKLLEEVFLSSDKFYSECEVVLETRVHAPFVEGTSGPTQLARFRNLSSKYIEKVDYLLAGFFKTFQEESVKEWIRAAKSTMFVKNFDADYLIDTFISLMATELGDLVAEPLFRNLHNQVSADETIWAPGSKYLIEEHAEMRMEIKKKLQLLNKLVDGWEDLCNQCGHESDIDNGSCDGSYGSKKGSYVMDLEHASDVASEKSKTTPKKRKTPIKGRPGYVDNKKKKSRTD